MSLINDMLNNLERRKNHNATSQPHLMQDLTSELTHELTKNRNYYAAIGVLGGILFVATVYVFFVPHASKTSQSLTSNVSPPGGNYATASPSDDSYLVKAATAPTLLTGIALQVQPNSSSLRFLLNQKVFYRLSTDVIRNEFIIIFEKTHLLASLPKINYLGSGVENIRAYIDEKGNLKLVLQLADDVDIKRVELNEEGKAPELQLELFFKNGSSAQTATQKNSTIPITIKKPVAENQAEQQYTQAALMIENGQVHQAINLLSAILINFPQYNLAREKLATLLLEQRQLNTASSLVAVGLKRFPDYLPFTEIKARILMQQGKIVEAIALLEASAPTLIANPEYHAFIAALYQRSGKPQMAANLYRQLIAVQPSNGKWWLGFGVALESLGNHEQALEAYANADNAGGLSPELKAFISTQLHNV